MENQRKAIEEELLRGRDMANQLLEVLVAQNKSNSNNNDDHDDDDKGLMVLLTYSEDLVHQVLRSFTNSLLILNTNKISGGVVDDDVFSDGGVVVDDPTKFRDFSSTTSPSLHTKNNRKRKSSVPTWEKDTPILIEDGHEWRKYGQKVTMNSKYLRHYYRCSHKNDQGCPATKQVQRIKENPPLFRTTYFGHHTCKSTYYEESILEPESFSGSSMFLSFNNNKNIITPSKEHVHHLSSSSQAFESANHIISQNQLLLSSSNYYHPFCDYEELGFNYSKYNDHVLSSTDEKVHFDHHAFGGDLLDFDGMQFYGQQN
ncbi:hypothetical protein PIB30_070853 [Stylosanthes scabra]|uniref:WRKY domain-containing protein n=1 Tax=Stylosanthes scabra TaxID=79078 RepID=A0ABU6TQ49_9FABA|nr:hypothetical protein [Stylosanthes scabra]